MKKMSSEEYLNTKLRPIFNAMTESLIRESPNEPVRFCLNLFNFLDRVHDQLA